MATLLFGASGVFGELRSSLNKIWDAQPADTGITGFARERFFSFGMVLSIGFMLMVSLVLSSALATASKYFEALIHAPLALLSVLNFLISLAGIAVLFALIFKFVPETDVHWRDVRLGAFFTAVLFTVGKALIALYIGRTGVGSPFGAAGSLVAMTVWVYYSAQIFLFGAEFTRVYSTLPVTAPGREMEAKRILEEHGADVGSSAERVPGRGQQVADTAPSFQEQEVRIPLSEECASVEKQPVVREEVRVGKRPVTDVETLREQVRSEELKVEQDVPAKRRPAKHQVVSEKKEGS
jgi:hypothetical protein